VSLTNVEVVRRAVEAISRGDRDGLREVAAPDLEYVASGAIPGAAGVFRGIQDFEENFFGQLWAEFDRPDIEIREIVDAGDRLAAWYTLRGRGKQSGAEVAWDVWQVWTLRDGKLARGRGYTSRDEALEALGGSADRLE